MSANRQRMREILARPGCTPTASVFDPLSTRIAEMMGWELCWLASSTAKAAEFAIPDEAFMSYLSDLVDICWRCMRVVDICLTADADCGGGPVLNVLRTVRELEAAGASAIELQDHLPVPPRPEFQETMAEEAAADPTRTGTRHDRFISKEAGVAKLTAAVAAKRDPATIIIARTHALEKMPRQEALDRITAYSETGVDALFIPGPAQSRDMIEAVHHVTPLPLVLTLAPEDARDEEFLARNNVKIRMLRGHNAYKAGVKAMYDSLKHLKEGGNPEDEELRAREAAPELLQAIIKVPEYTQFEEKYYAG